MMTAQMPGPRTGDSIFALSMFSAYAFVAFVSSTQAAAHRSRRAARPGVAGSAWPLTRLSFCCTPLYLLAGGINSDAERASAK